MQLAYSVTARTLFVGTNKGTVLLYRWPLDEATHYDEYVVHTCEAQRGT